MTARSTRLGAVTSVAIVAVLVTAAPAEARRNVGGSGPSPEICVLPGQAALRTDGRGFGAICICVIAGDGSVVRAVGTMPNALCPPGIRQP